MSRLRHPTARLRLALLYGGLFLALGTVLIVLTLVVTRPQVVGSIAVAPQGPGAPLSRLLFAHPAAPGVGHLMAAAWVVILLTALVSVPLGWFASGWMIRPVRQITERARTISAGNLHERLRLSGPQDEFKQLGDTLDDLLARLQAAFDAQRRFVANASHELLTPLTVERTLLQVTLADPEASAQDLRATCEELLAAGREQERLVEAMLVLAQSEQGLDRHEPVDLAATVAAVLQRPRPELDAGTIELATDLRAALVQGDQALLERLISNLVDNAFEHNLPGGMVHISTGVNPNGAYITVSNSGVVIGPEEIGVLFEPFRRLGQPRIVAGEGHHGLGLSIVRAIAAAHQASVRAEPREGGGLSLTVSFPLLEARSAVQAP